VILSNLKKDFKKVLIDEEVSQNKVAQEIETSPQYFNRVLSEHLIKEMFIKALDYLGYDIEVRLIKR